MEFSMLLIFSQSLQQKKTWKKIMAQKGVRSEEKKNRWLSQELNH